MLSKTHINTFYNYSFSIQGLKIAHQELFLGLELSENWGKSQKSFHLDWNYLFLKFSIFMCSTISTPQRFFLWKVYKTSQVQKEPAESEREVYAVLLFTCFMFMVHLHYFPSSSSSYSGFLFYFFFISQFVHLLFVLFNFFHSHLHILLEKIEWVS